MSYKVKKEWAKNLWIDSQKLNTKNPFGQGSGAVAQAVQHLGYVQIDTINVIERCHHHILFNRIPAYRKSDLEQAQARDKTVFEYWTHALAYVPSQDYKYFVSRMRSTDTSPGSWYGAVSQEDYKKVKKLLKNGPVTIREIKDDVLKEKTHDWDSKKPSKKALQLGFNNGDFVISRREGMLKVYDLSHRHFGWSKPPRAASDAELVNYTIDRALRSQGLVSLESICHLVPSRKPVTEAELNKRVKRGELVQVHLDDSGKAAHWVRPDLLEQKLKPSALTHILSPFDPLVIQRKRLKYFFDYEHLFEAYIPKAKRKHGYFTLPVLGGNEIIAMLDLKTDRKEEKLLIQNWIWRKGHKSSENKLKIEKELGRFEKFQLGD